MRFAIAERLPILVVDDDSALIRTLADILRMHGYDPLTALTGKEGLELAAHNPPMLAVVDLRLPDMDGMEVVARLHALSELTEVVVLTGNGTLESAVAALREHSVDYLLKPVQVERLLSVVSGANDRWQRRQAEERLRDSDERFRRVVQSDMVGIMFWDAEGAISDANDAFLRMVGYSRLDLERGAMNWRAMTPPAHAAVNRAKLEELREHGVVPPYETECFTQDGGRVPILIGAATLEGRHDRGVCFVLDITDRKLAEHALETRALQQAAVASFGRHALLTPTVAMLCDDAVELVSATLDLPLAGVLEKRFDGKTLILRAGVGWTTAQVGQTEVPITEDTAAGYTLLHNEPTISTDVEAEGRFTGVLLHEHGLGSGITVVIPGSIHPYGVLNAHDHRPRQFTQDDVHFLQAIAHVVGTAIDRDRTDTAFRQAQRLEAVGRLASGIAHDFNNMLTAIMGYGEMVKSALPAGHEFSEDVQEILTAANRAASLTRQLLALSRQQVLQPRMFHLNDVISEMDKMLRRLISADIEFTTSLDPDLGWIRADPGQIEQVILNLCMNARDAVAPGGKLTVETANIELDESQSREYGVTVPGPYVMLAVSDTGSGIDAETKARIFEPFFTTKPADKGTGLGLATVYGIVKQSSGEVWVSSEVGRGTVFKVFLPRIVDSPVVSPENDARSAAIGGSETILLAEDDDSVRRIAQRILEQIGYTVITARDGLEASKIAEEHAGPIHLLVTDLVMPGLNGPQLVEQIRQRRPETGVLYLSGYTDATIAGQVVLGKATHFLQKPFATDALARCVREALDSPR